MTVRLMTDFSYWALPLCVDWIFFPSGYHIQVQFLCFGLHFHKYGGLRVTTEFVPGVFSSEDDSPVDAGDILSMKVRIEDDNDD